MQLSSPKRVLQLQPNMKLMLIDFMILGDLYTDHSFLLTREWNSSYGFFYQDNASPHRALSAHKFLIEKEITHSVLSGLWLKRRLLTQCSSVFIITVITILIPSLHSSNHPTPRSACETVSISQILSKYKALSWWLWMVSRKTSSIGASNSEMNLGISWLVLRESAPKEIMVYI